MQVNEVDRETFVTASRPVYDEFDARVPGGGDWIAAARALANFDLERAAHPGDEAPAEATVGDEQAAEVAATAVVASALLGIPDVVQRR